MKETTVLLKELVKELLTDNLEIKIDTFWSDDKKLLEVKLNLFGETISRDHIDASDLTNN